MVSLKKRQTHRNRVKKWLLGVGVGEIEGFEKRYKVSAVRKIRSEDLMYNMMM